VTVLASWDKDETRKLVIAHWGNGQLWTITPVLRAVTARQSHARYHFEESKRLQAEHVAAYVKEPEDLFWVMFPSEDEEVDRVNSFFCHYEAHVLACAQAIHATADILAHVVYFALGLNLGEKSLKDTQVDLGSVIKLLERRAPSGPPAWLALRASLEVLKSSTAFGELADVVNHAKHRGGPGAVLTFGPTEEKPFEMQFSGFIRGKYRPAKESGALLAPAFEAVNKAVVDAGMAINACLRSLPGD
jgi:hypothetical protein